MISNKEKVLRNRRNRSSSLNFICSIAKNLRNFITSEEQVSLILLFYYVYNTYVYATFILLPFNDIRNIFHQIARVHALRAVPGGKWKRRKLMATPAESSRKAEIISRYQDYREKDSRTSH